MQYVLYQHTLKSSREGSFNESRSNNANATAQGTDGQMANIPGTALQSMEGSRGVNVGKRKSFRVAEIASLKVKKRKMVARVPAQVPKKLVRSGRHNKNKVKLFVFCGFCNKYF